MMNNLQKEKEMLQKAKALQSGPPK